MTCSQLAAARRTTTSAPTAAPGPRRAGAGTGRAGSGSSAGVSSTPLPSALATATRAGAHRLHQARHAERRVAAQLQRIAEVVVQAAQDRRRTGCRPSSVFRKTRLVAHRQVAALDQREAEVAGEVGVLEVGLVVRARA